MEFLGVNGVPAPQLRSASIPPALQAEVYEQVIEIMRGLFHGCKLVHADLSEYNLLYLEERVFVIDVGQSVVTSHPRAQVGLGPRVDGG